jgi:hypothetical protein
MLTLGDFHYQFRICSNSTDTRVVETRKWRPETVIDNVRVHDNRIGQIFVFLDSNSIRCSSMAVCMPYGVVLVAREVEL